MKRWIISLAASIFFTVLFSTGFIMFLIYFGASYWFIGRWTNGNLLSSGKKLIR